MIQQGRNFRPEFIEAVMCIKKLFRASPSPFPRIAMSATFLCDDIDGLLRLLNVVLANANLIWTKMDQRTKFFDVIVSGNPPICVRSSIVNDYRSLSLENLKVIVYCNSKKSVEDSLVPMANLALRTSGIDGNCMAFTGDDGVMQKIYLMHLFCSQADELDEEVGLGYRLMILAAMTAANCGVSSPDCHRVYQLGLLTNFYNLVQGMGRCDRSGYNWEGDDRYKIHVSYPLFLSFYI